MRDSKPTSRLDLFNTFHSVANVPKAVGAGRATIQRGICKTAQLMRANLWQVSIPWSYASQIAELGGAQGYGPKV